MDPVGKKTAAGAKRLNNERKMKGGDQEREYRAREDRFKRELTTGAIARKTSERDQNPFGVAERGCRDLL